MLLNDVTPDCLQVGQNGGQWASGTGVHIELTSDYRPVDVVTVGRIHIQSLHEGRMEKMEEEEKNGWNRDKEFR